MSKHADKVTENKNTSPAADVFQRKSEPTVQLADNRPNAVAQRKTEEAVNNSPRVQQLKTYQRMADARPNRTGLPDNLKSGVENLSGIDMNDVKVHYNSSRPSQLQAHAYAQGSDIHLAPGQERHLPHEAWHIVQQKQGRVQPTMQMKGKINVNDNIGLEHEADVMGAKAVQATTATETHQLKTIGHTGSVMQLAALAADKLNVVGETHDESDLRRGPEKAYSNALAGGGYWRESAFKVTVDERTVSADPAPLRFLFALHIITAKSDSFLSAYNVATIINDVHNKYEAIQTNIDFAKARFNETIGVAYPGPLTDEKIAIRDDILTGRYKALEEFEIALMEINSLHGRVLDGDELASTEDFYEMLVRAKIGMIGNLMHSPDLNLIRSKQMHEVAQEKADTKGVWKIGNAHVAHIKDKLPDIEPPAYNLVTKEEFNYMMENPTPAEASKLGLYDE